MNTPSKSDEPPTPAPGQDSEPMEAEQEQAAKRRRFLLRYPGEDELADYKAAVKFEEKAPFSYELARHVLGMANAGGGHLVIGYKENSHKKPEPDSAMSPDIASSYDVTRIAQFVERFIEGTDRIDIKVWHETHEEATYPIIDVRGFAERPFFCRSTIDAEEESGRLQKGVVYIRIPGARTIPIAGPDEWQRLIEQCVEKQQGKLIDRLTAILEEAGFFHRGETEPAPTTTPELTKEKPLRTEVVTHTENGHAEAVEAEKGKSLDEWAGFQSNKARESIKTAGCFEIQHGLVASGSGYAWNREQLRNAARDAVLRNTGWPMGLVAGSDRGKPAPSDDGLSALLTRDDPSDYWALRKNGDYFLLRRYQEDEREDAKRELWFDVQIWRITEAILHANALYIALGVHPTDQIRFKMTYYDLQDRVLRPSPNTMRTLFTDRKATVSQVPWGVEASVDDLKVHLKDHVAAMTSELFEVFDLTRLERHVVDGMVDEFLGSAR